MIYLDHAATTPLDRRVLDAMQPYLTETFGNASSVHSAGRQARVAVDDARERIASSIGAEPSEIVFTSGGTEADALAIGGVLAAGGALVTSAAEHEAVLRPAERLAAAGRAIILTPDSFGAVTPDQLDVALKTDRDSRVRLVSLMSANNEVGTLTDIQGLADVCARYGVLLHTDAVQSVGLLDVNVDALGVDLLSASAHKFYGPKGAGFLYVRGGTALEPLIAGSQERKRRGGTENVPAIIGMASALELAMSERAARYELAVSLRHRLFERLDGVLPGEYRLVSPRSATACAPHVVNIAFPPVDGRPMDGEMLILNMDVAGVAVSAGSACTSGALEPSHVLTAMNYDRETASAVIRFSTGRNTTVDEIDRAVDVLARVVTRMRKLAIA